MSKTKTYVSWVGLKRRCLDIKYDKYKNYGGRGIEVCKRWLKFENFYEDMGERPNGKTLDRIDNNGNYCQKNCRWATNIEQQNNKRNNRFLTYKNETKSIKIWAKNLNINYGIFCMRIYRKWSIEKILTRPMIHRKLN